MTFKLDTQRLVLSFNTAVPASASLSAKLVHIAGRLTKLGLQTHPATIQKWIERDMLPGNRLVDLAILARHNGQGLNLVDYLINQTRKA